MYVFMCVCMCVCIYVSMYVRSYVTRICIPISYAVYSQTSFYDYTKCTVTVIMGMDLITKSIVQSYLNYIKSS